jgi:hypothetical protein
MAKYSRLVGLVLLFSLVLPYIALADIQLSGSVETPSDVNSRFQVDIGSNSGSCTYETFRTAYPDTSQQQQSGICNWSDWDEFSDGNRMSIFYTGSPSVSEKWLKIVDVASGDIFYSRFNWNGSAWSFLQPDYDVGILDFEPSVGSTTPTTTVYFEATVFNDSATEVVFQYTNLDTGFQYVPLELELNASGIVTVSATSTLAEGLYSGTVRMVGSLSNPPSKVLSFTVVRSNAGFLPLASTTLAASSTVAFCQDANILVSFGCSLFLPSPASLAQFTQLQSTFETKIPFSYFYQIRDVLVEPPATSSLPTLDLEIGTSTDAFHLDVTLFSSDTLREFIPDSLSTTIRLVTTAFLWFELVWYLWRRTRGLIRHAHSSVQ